MGPSDIPTAGVLFSMPIRTLSKMTTPGNSVSEKTSSRRLVNRGNLLQEGVRILRRGLTSFGFRAINNIRSSPPGVARIKEAAHVATHTFGVDGSGG